MPHRHLERRHGAVVAGIDEAGRGPWAGPVVAAAVVLDQTLPSVLTAGIDDSKRLSAARRSALLEILRQHARIGVGRAEVQEIDTLNILEATMLAMRRAVAALGAPPPVYALVDGNRTPSLPCPATAIIKGDATCLSIAAASVVAKVTRDREMAALAVRYPGYGWERNAGYGTAEHRDALTRLGVTPHHRRSFAPIRNMLSER